MSVCLSVCLFSSHTQHYQCIEDVGTWLPRHVRLVLDAEWCQLIAERNVEARTISDLHRHRHSDTFTHEEVFSEVQKQNSWKELAYTDELGWWRIENIRHQVIGFESEADQFSDQRIIRMSDIYDSGLS
jgi:hypothetical protein